MKSITTTLLEVMALLTSLEADQSSIVIVAENDPALSLTSDENDTELFEARMKVARNNRLLEYITIAKEAVEKAASQSRRI